jgi:hypothetical protein
MSWPKPGAGNMADASWTPCPGCAMPSCESAYLLLEGQLGVGRDINWGIYPFSTASSPTAGGAAHRLRRPAAGHRRGAGRGQGLLHLGGRGSLSHGAARRVRRQTAGDRPGVRRDHGPAPALWLAGRRLPGLCQLDQRLYRHRRDQAGCPRRPGPRSDLHRLSPGQGGAWTMCPIPSPRAWWNRYTKDGPAGRWTPAAAGLGKSCRQLRGPTWNASQS